LSLKNKQPLGFSPNHKNFISQKAEVMKLAVKDKFIDCRYQSSDQYHSCLASRTEQHVCESYLGLHLYTNIREWHRDPVWARVPGNMGDGQSQDWNSLTPYPRRIVCF